MKAIDGLNRIAKLELVNTSASGSGTLEYKDTIIPVGGVGGTGYTTGNVVWAQTVNKPGYSYDGSPDGTNGLLYHYSADLYQVGGTNTDGSLKVEGGGAKFWLTTETYVINNSGAIQSKDDIVNSGTDPFTLLSKTAGEIILGVKAYQNNAATYGQISGTDYFAYASSMQNIDLVFIPDLFVDAVETMLPSIVNMGKNNKTSSVN